MFSVTRLNFRDNELSKHGRFWNDIYNDDTCKLTDFQRTLIKYIKNMEKELDKSLDVTTGVVKSRISMISDFPPLSAAQDYYNECLQKEKNAIYQMIASDHKREFK